MRLKVWRVVATSLSKDRYTGIFVALTIEDCVTLAEAQARKFRPALRITKYSLVDTIEVGV